MSDVEAQRLEALQRYHILDTPAEPAFDDLVQLPMVTESQFQGFLAMPNVHVGQGKERQGQ